MSLASLFVRTLSLLTISFLVLSVFAFPSTSFAQDPGPAGLVVCEGPECNFCHLVQQIDVVVDWIVTISTIFVALVLIYAGFKLVFSGGNQAAYAKAKVFFVNALIGLVLLLGAWTIVDTVLKALTVSGGGTYWEALRGQNIGNIWADVECGQQYRPVPRDSDGDGIGENPEPPGPGEPDPDSDVITGPESCPDRQTRITNVTATGIVYSCIIPEPSDVIVDPAIVPGLPEDIPDDIRADLLDYCTEVGGCEMDRLEATCLRQSAERCTSWNTDAVITARCSGGSQLGIVNTSNPGEVLCYGARSTPIDSVDTPTDDPANPPATTRTETYPCNFGLLGWNCSAQTAQCNQAGGTPVTSGVINRVVTCTLGIGAG